MLGSRFQAKVRDISIEGYGVVDHPDQFVLFVLGAFPGDEAVFEVISLKKRYGYAKVLEWIHLSPDRLQGPCPHAGIEEGLCGGCPWMSLQYSKQLEYKRHMLQYALRRDHLISSDGEIPPIHGSPSIFGFRNRAQFKTDGDRLGFVSRFSRVIAPIKGCLVLNAPLQTLVQEALQSLPQESWRPTPPHHWSYIDLDDTLTLEGIVPNKRRPFRQGNTEQNIFMQNWVREKTTHWSGGNGMELFCGSGNFTKILAQQNLKRLLATDIASLGVAALREQIQNEHCYVLEANLFRPSEWKLLKAENPFPDFLLLDPPRDGFKNIDLFVSQFGFPREIVYISCHLETFTRDAGRLKKKGYRITEILGIDQFPHTPHIEILAVLRRP